METSHSGKLEQNYNAQTCIADDARLLEDKQKLKEELEEFQKETGISVAVETRRYCHATSMREYAMDEYYRHFTDESHWLICYVGTEKDRTDEWAWELVCGDDCIQVLDYDQEDQFTQAFQNGLYNTKDSLDEVLMNSLHSLEPRLEWHIYGDGKSSVIFWLCMMIPSVYGMIYGALKLWGPIPPRHVAKMKAKATASPQGELEYKQCPNCGGYKVKGTTSKCPYCGSGYYVQ